MYRRKKETDRGRLLGKVVKKSSGKLKQSMTTGKSSKTRTVLTLDLLKQNN